MKALLLLALGALLVAPSAYAAEIQAVLETNHPPEHKVKVPETRRVSEPLHVKLAVKDTVCAQAAVWAVDATITYDQEWAGVSLNPKATEVTIPQGEPGTTPKTYAAEKDIMIDVFWGENRPKTNAEITYTITVSPDQIKLDSGGPCLPDPGQNKKGTSVQITFRGDDIVEAGNLTAGPNCAQVPDDPACIEPTTFTPRGESPGVGTFVLLAAAALAVGLRRRRF